MSSNHQPKSLDRMLAYIIAVIVTLITAIGGLRLIDTYVRIEDFLLYRLSFNFSEGNGLFYNPTEKAFPTLSPIPAVIIGLFRTLLNQSQTLPQSYMPILATLIFTFGYGLVAIILYHRLHQTDFSRSEIIFVTLAWLAVYPLWAAIHTPAPYTLFLILFAIHLGEKDQWRIAGLLAGLSILIQPEGAFGCLALGLYALTKERGWRFWHLVWLPITIWLIIAAFYYTDSYWSGLISISRPVTSDSTPQNLLWIILLIVSTLIAFRFATKNWLWILYSWAAFEIIAHLLIYGQLTQIHSLALALCVPISHLFAVRHLKLSQPLSRAAMSGGIITIALITILALPKTDDDLAHDMELSRSIGIPKDTSVLHDRSDGIIRHLDEFTSDIYHFDGTRSPFVTDFVERGDYESLIIATAPDMIYFDTENEALRNLNLQSETLRPLNYRKTLDVFLDPGQNPTDESWTRYADVGEFGDIQSLDLNFGPDVQLIAYALDHSRPQSGDTLRIRLDWSLDRPPTSSMTIQLSLLDNIGNPIASIFPSFDQATWTTLDLSTYHALTIPADTPPGRLRIQAALDYKAALIGENQVGTLVVAAPRPDTLPEPVGRISDAILYESIITPTDSGLNVDLLWGVENRLSRDYQVLVHFTPLDDVQPLSNGDGPPVNGRFPTSDWLPNEVVSDSHFIPLNLNDIPAGTYRVNVGFYILETFERLRDESRDSLTIAHIQIADDGTITVLPPE